MRAYSTDLRERVLADCDAGTGTRAVAEKYRVSPAWVRRLKQRRRNGELAPRSSRNRRQRTLVPYYDRIRELIAACPDLTLAELHAQLKVVVGLTTLWEAVKLLGLTLKKKSSVPPSRIGPT